MKHHTATPADTRTTFDATAPSLTQKDVAARWQCSAMTVRRRMQEGQLPYYVVGTRHVRFALEDLLKIERASRVEIPQAV